MLVLLALAHATPGEVTMPLDAWNQLHPPAAAVAPPASPLPIRRTLRGKVDRGLLEATLHTEVQVMAPLRMPVLPAEATVADARLDGRPAALSLDDHYRVDLGPGRHVVDVELLHGQATDRFERRVRLPLPDGGPTRFDLVLPEAPIDVTLAAGVITETTRQGGTTRVVGWLDGAGDLDLAWERRASHDATDARVDTEVHALLELGGDLVVGRAATTFEVLSGDVDRVDLVLPAGVEITGVIGPDVLQWHTRSGRLEVLLRRVVEERVALDVRFQYPAELDGPTPLLLPLPEGEVRGALGVVAPVAMDVEIAEVDGATPISSRDMPQALVELSPEPLRLAMAFSGNPSAAASTTRQGEVITSASRIDDLQGISIAMEDGTEVGKLRLAVRNADRQVLSVDLPEGARLTHCFRDGVPLRPAADALQPGRVLVPLTRSRKTEERTYTVQAGDTLSFIATDNYGDANQWQQVQWANPELDGDRLRVGQVLRLPALADSDTESFMLEMGWERRVEPMGSFGRRAVALPTLDLDVHSATWHLYLPQHLETLTVDSNLTQLSGVHTDPLTRMVDFLVQSGVTGSSAYAGGTYKNAIQSRRSTYEAESSDIRAQAEPLSAYPLVGQRIRFRGSLLGTDAPMASVRYVGEGLASALRSIVFLAALGLGWLLGREPRKVATWAAIGASAVGAGVMGHYLLGTYSRVAWGADLGLLVALLPMLWSRRRRPRATEVLGALALGFVLLVVLLVKTTLFPILLAAGLVAAARRLS